MVSETRNASPRGFYGCVWFLYVLFFISKIVNYEVNTVIIHIRIVKTALTMNELSNANGLTEKNKNTKKIQQKIRI